MRRMIVTLSVLAGLVVSLSAQVRYRPTEQGPWRPWSFNAIASARQARGASAAEVQAFQATLQSLAAIVRRAPAVATPMGFAAEMWGNLDGYGPPAPGQPAGKSVPLAGELSFAAFPLVEFTRNGRLVNEDLKGGETETMAFAVNSIESAMYSAQRPVEWRDADVEGFLEPQVGAPVAGLPRVADILVVKNNPKPLWIPVTLDEALQPVVAFRMATLEHQRGVYEKEKASFAEWQTPAKRAERRAQWAKAAASIPKGDEFVANMEKSDTQIEAVNQAQLAPGGSLDKSVTEAERELQEAQAVLTAVSPSDKAAASCYERNASTLARKFRSATGQGGGACRAIVKPNWGYFDPKLPRSAAQVVMVMRFGRCLEAKPEANEHRGGCVINRELLASMDWAAVRAALDR